MFLVRSCVDVYSNLTYLVTAVCHLGGNPVFSIDSNADYVVRMNLHLVRSGQLPLLCVPFYRARIVI